MLKQNGFLEGRDMVSRVWLEKGGDFVTRYICTCCTVRGKKGRKYKER